MPAPSLDIEGAWQMIRAESNGEQVPDLVVKNTEMEFRDGFYVIRFDRQECDRGVYELGSTSETRTMTLYGQIGSNIGRTIPCIFQLVGDRLRICYGLNEVPTDFLGSRGGRYLAVYRRMKV